LMGRQRVYGTLAICNIKDLQWQSVNSHENGTLLYGAYDCINGCGGRVSGRNKLVVRCDHCIAAYAFGKPAYCECNGVISVKATHTCGKPDPKPDRPPPKKEKIRSNVKNSSTLESSTSL
jgi:hypothetical protein